MKDVVEAAIKYVDHDISIVPIRFRLKRLDFKLLRSTMPALGTMLPYLNKVPTKKEIVTWFGNKDSNLGIVTGYKDTFCIDFDDERSFEDWKERFPFVFSHTPVQKPFEDITYS